MNLYYLIGLRKTHYRKAAVAALALDTGDAVVEIGCGTGLNFPYPREAVGERGRVIGVDITDAMLARAGRRIAGHGWRTFTLVRSDTVAYAFPSGVHGILSTFALPLALECEAVIARAAAAPRGRLVVLDLRRSAGWPIWLVRLAVFFAKPFGVTIDLADRKPWEVMRRYFPPVETKGFFGGAVYLAVGRKA